MKTISESGFEKFLADNGLPFQRVEEQESPRPDYLVRFGETKVFFEVKELSEDQSFATEPLKVYTRTLGAHIRKKIRAASKQIKFGADLGIPSVLLVYNNLDGAHQFGTAQEDFISAMYGAPMIRIDLPTMKAVDSFHGQDRSFGKDWNRSFSAVGHLYPFRGKLEVTLYENVFAKVKVPFDVLPSCFEVKRIEITDSGYA